jgi:predicted transcriptional regulator
METTNTPAPVKKGRPAKYANAAERQRAYRAANAVKTVRLTGKVPGSVAELAEYFDMSQSEVLNQLLKFALTNRDWKSQGMTAWAHPDRRRATAPKATPVATFVTGN